MWALYAFGSAFFAGLTAILAKLGLRRVDSHVATALRTIVVLALAWGMVFVVGSQGMIGSMQPRTLLFLVLSGLATGASWICYFRALQLGTVNGVTPIDKSSVILTMLMAFLFLGESITPLKLLAMIIMATGTYYMIEKSGKTSRHPRDTRWIIYASLAAFFAALTAILGKVGIMDIESNLGTAIRTVVVLIMAWLVVFMTRKQHDVTSIDRASWWFIILSGGATGASWLCYYHALQTGPASIVVPIDKLSIVATVIFSYFFLHERLRRRSFGGLVLIVTGTLLLLI